MRNKHSLHSHSGRPRALSDTPTTKHTFFHVTVQEHNETNHHFLVPRLSDQADNDPVQVSAFGLRGEQPFPEYPTSPNDKTLVTTDPFVLPERPRSNRTKPSPHPVETKTRRTHRDRRDVTIPPSVSIGFTAAMKPVGYAECVSVTDAPPAKEASVVSFCDFEVDARFKNSVNIGPGLSPAWFQSRVVCHNTTSKKNFKTSVDYIPKLKPLKFEETNYVRPKHLVMSYVSYFDYNANDSQKWYTTSVEFVPRSGNQTIIHNFNLDRKVTSSEDNHVITNGDDLMAGDVNMNVINKNDLADDRLRQPTMMISSGPENDHEQLFGSTYMSHRTKMVVGGTGSSRRMDNEDYQVYLEGYTSGDVIHQAFPVNGDVTNGFLTQNTSEA